MKVVTRSQPEVRVAIGQAWTTTRGQIAIADLPSAEVAATGSVDVAPIDLVDRHAIEIAPETATQVGSAGSTRPPGKKVVVKEDARKALLTAGIQPAYDIGIADPKAAIQKHLEVVANTRNEEASRAQYSIAVLQKLALKDNAAALKTLDRYFDRFAHKNKSEHGDALWLRVRILCEKTFDDDCRRAARMYAAEAPSTFKSGIAEKILDGL